MVEIIENDGLVEDGDRHRDTGQSRENAHKDFANEGYKIYELRGKLYITILGKVSWQIDAKLVSLFAHQNFFFLG